MLPTKYCHQQFYRLSLILIIGIAFALPIFAQTGILVGSMSQCDTQMQTFLTNYQIPGATFYDRLIVGLAVIVIVVMDQVLLKRGE